MQTIFLSIISITGFATGLLCLFRLRNQSSTCVLAEVGVLQDTGSNPIPLPAAPKQPLPTQIMPPYEFPAPAGFPQHASSMSADIVRAADRLTPDGSPVLTPAANNA